MPPVATDVVRPRFVAKDDPRRFEIKTGAVRAIKAIDPADNIEKMYLEGTASSTVDDRMGDTLDAFAQTKMVEQARGLVMWLNHSYTVPEDILGTCREASLQSGTDESQGECIDLMIRLEIDAENPRAVKAWKHVDGGTKLGFSIGGIWLDFDFKNEDDWWDWTVTVHDVDLLEISLVGIPANPRAYTKGFVEFATRSLHSHIDTFVKTLGSDGPKTPAVREMVKKAMLSPHMGEERSRQPALEEKLLDPTETAPTGVKDAQTETPATEPDTTPAAEVTDPAAFAREAEEAALKAAEPTTGDVVVDEAAPATETTAETTAELEQRSGAPATADAVAPETRSADNGANPLNDEQKSAALGAMKSLKSIHVHGLCLESMGHVALAHKAIRSLLPDDYDVPGDADLPSDPEEPTASSKSAIELLSPKEGDLVVVRGADMATVAALTEAFPGVKFLAVNNDEALSVDADLATKIADRDSAQTALEAANAALKTATDAHDAIVKETTTLETKLAELRATPTGRRSAQPGGSTQDGSSGPLVSAEMYHKSDAEAAAAVGAAAVIQDKNDSRLRAIT